MKLEDREETNVTNGGWLHEIIPDGIGGWMSKKIRVSTLFNSINSRVTALENNLGNYSITKYTNKSAAFTHVLEADENLTGVDLRFISGSPVIKIGTSAGSDNIMSERTLVTGVDDSTYIGYPVQVDTTLYITVTGGNASITLTIRNNMF